MDGWIEVTGAPGCFPTPDEVGGEVYGVVTTVADGSQAGTLVEPDGSWSARIEAESGDQIAVHYEHGVDGKSQPCTLTVP